MRNNGKLRAWVDVDLSALERNLHKIRAALPAWMRFIAVVKADAYGHGIVQTAIRLMKAGVNMFAVANLREAGELRETGSGWPILILSAILPQEDSDILEYDVIPTISTAAEVERFNRLGERAGRPWPVHLKIDTGMGRLGVWHAQAGEVYARLRDSRHLRLEGIYTHFSSADSNPEFTRLQRETFIRAVFSLPGLPADKLLIHADNSAGLESLGSESPFNAVRVGLLPYGVRPYPASLLGGVTVEPVLSFHSRVGLVKELPAGVPISYNRTHVLSRPTRLAVITAGYGDGLPTSLSNRAQVLVHGCRCPVLGRVTMDQTVVDVTRVEGVESGDLVTIIGRQGSECIDVAEFSAWAGHIPWETFVNLSKRVKRCYISDSAM